MAGSVPDEHPLHMWLRCPVAFAGAIMFGVVAAHLGFFAVLLQPVQAAGPAPPPDWAPLAMITFAAVMGCACLGYALVQVFRRGRLMARGEQASPDRLQVARHPWAGLPLNMVSAALAGLMRVRVVRVRYAFTAGGTTWERRDTLVVPAEGQGDDRWRAAVRVCYDPRRPRRSCVVLSGGRETLVTPQDASQEV